MKNLFEKVKNWWMKYPVKTRQKWEIVGFTLLLLIVFGTIISFVNLVN
jgi:hypothetical protein